MAQLLIRDLEPELVTRLKSQAQQHNRSLQGEVKAILQQSAVTTLPEMRATAATWQERLGGRAFSDSSKLIREDRER